MNNEKKVKTEFINKVLYLFSNRKMEIIIILLIDIAIVISAFLTLINESKLFEVVIATLIIIIFFNTIMITGFIFVEKMQNKIHNVKSNYSINMWLSESDNLPVNILPGLINIKSKQNDLLYNYNKSKEVILKECKTTEELKVLKIFLEVNKESKRKDMYNITIQSIIIAITIPVFVEMIKSKISFEILSIIFLAFFTILGMYFLYILVNARKNNKVNFLLKIVNQCIEEEENKQYGLRNS
ncbi:hypothetical protein MST22_17455 [Virgibacillus halodenitrificans]|uniref:hypothetical protein n=1 Tax=Virgibacillus halodenitrificans TaxID=1482 RepID=UPI001FB2ED39|nr:hypothetical protein [Virgibacillus halodenitrificans]MCJ0932941.1 hypothetical protein [Virgibacillus halodenitrificans]